MYGFLTLRCNEKIDICHTYYKYRGKAKQNALSKCTSECKYVGFKSVLTRNVINILVSINSLGSE